MQERQSNMVSFNSWDGRQSCRLWSHLSKKTEQPINHHCSGAVGGCLGSRSISGSSSFPSAAGCCDNQLERPEGARAVSETTEAHSGHLWLQMFFFPGSLSLRP